MDLKIAPADERFRDEVRCFIAAELTPELRQAGLGCTGIYNAPPAARSWHQILAKRGWSVPAWPCEHGGTGWSPLQHYIFEREMAEAGAPTITPNATHMVAPVVMAFGTDEQKACYLHGIRTGSDWWAQGYSETDAGSDLASLRCTALRDGNYYVVNGSKIWTTHAQFCNRIFCLVRTRREDKPQKGISFLLFDLDLPGIEIRPIISMSGEHELNETVFRDVHVPVSALLGTENDGWAIAKYLLQHERAHSWTPLLRARLGRMRARATLACIGAGHCLIDDPIFAAKLASAEIRLSVMEVGEWRILAAATSGEPLPSNVSSVMKVQGTELRQHMTELAVEIEGSASYARWPADRSLVALNTHGPDAMASYLNDRAASIYAGTNEVQRNIIARALLR